MPSSPLSQARILLAKQAYREAHALCLQALQQDPDLGEPYVLLGVVAADHHNHAKAIDLYDRALALDAEPAETLAQKARSLIALNRRDQALACVKDAATYQPTSASTLDMIGVVFSRAGLHALALPWYEKAVAAAPQSAHHHYNLAVALQFVGQMDGAREAYEKCLSLAPTDTRALTGLVQVSRQTFDGNHLDRLEAAYREISKRPPEQAADALLHICHAIGKTLEDLGRPAKAMDWFARGKAAKRATLDYSFAQDQALFTAAIATTDHELAEGVEPSAPIFIVGLPRTGTTLVDRILSSHPDITSAGELSDFALCLKRQLNTPSRFVLDAETLTSSSRADMGTLGRDYIRQVRATLGIQGRFIDKMPLNAFYVPLMLKALPKARVICLRRHPLDTVLSNYRQLFATSFSYYNYALDLETAARYYAGFDRMIAHFRDTLPSDRFTEVHYEGIIANQEGETRRLLAFCGLEFDPACLSFHENAAPVATASSVQVRKPLYSSSLGRWRKVAEQLAPAIAILQEAGLLEESDIES
ncbi:tetratricopeptide repeat-containing sulfotransferase family protein [Henriciella sp.]|uniref:tetratricopeptide repeat-containing sulfotransferase family protein n=1 Tax=Henriciella sp. TaxID=1968823 RepID=UPI00261A6F4A|nr:tetratricopeptide repeat-containing sulfotransferase family protein [Henriciella sp.]